MLNNVYWNMFQKSGDIDAYIAYRKETKKIGRIDNKKINRKDDV